MPDYVPALKAQMGDWTYYVTVMKFGKIARECRSAEEILSHGYSNNLIQGEIEDGVSKDMVPYLLKEKQRFYSAIVVVVHGGQPEFSPVYVEQYDLIDSGFGVLRFDGSQVYYAVDGQRRLKSIQEAIRLDAEIAKEEIVVIILKHEQTKAGIERTRRLFSTLNRRG